MVVPPGYSEAEVLRIIDEVAASTPRRIEFPGFTREDAKQEAVVLALEALASGKYDPSRRPLKHFLATHVRNRLANLRRDTFCRKSPCQRCHDGDYCTGNDKPCKLFANWKQINNKKVTLGSTIGNETTDRRVVHPVTESRVAEEAQGGDLEQLIDEWLPVELRGPYMRMRDGASVHTNERKAVRVAIAEILAAADIDVPPEDEWVHQGRSCRPVAEPEPDLVA